MAKGLDERRLSNTTFTEEHCVLADLVDGIHYILGLGLTTGEKVLPVYGRLA